MQRVVILGGGTSGWMAANLLRRHLDAHRFDITLVESPDIGTIGVGEGSTPHLKVFFDELNIPESQWMAACNATYKNGISFVNWTSHLESNRYFHPFPSFTDRQTAAAFLTHCHLKFKGIDAPTNPDQYFLSSYLSQHHLSPKVAPGKTGAPLNYAYHFDSTLLGKYLQNIACKEGVTHISNKVQDVAQHPDGRIASLLFEDGGVVNGDWFVDASGFRSQLMQQTLQVGFESFSDNLINDSAIALASHDISPISSETTATALNNGWAWRIPLTNRVGNGYVFSRAHCDFTQAEAELRAHIGDDASGEDARHIHMKVGQVQEHWHKNTIALGLSQGFIEPLEATALHLVLETLISFIANFKQGECVDADRKAFNQHMSRRYQGIRDYIVCHYKINTRSDTPYWQEVKRSVPISDNLRAVIDAWDAGQDITPTLQAQEMDKYYPAVSWYCLLAGYGRFNKQTRAPSAQAKHTLKQVQAYIAQSSAQFMSHATALTHA
ncbi:tryptophan halogenase family protein [Glaciecola siphonariae]|uniref:Tryptophan halogenase family protein n=1 Tax=Glaciecola siphonariae TaxID=521012 RepID=A0ABV9LU24_9ALTE